MDQLFLPTQEGRHESPSNWLLWRHVKRLQSQLTQQASTISELRQAQQTQAQQLANTRRKRLVTSVTGVAWCAMTHDIDKCMPSCDVVS